MQEKSKNRQAAGMMAAVLRSIAKDQPIGSAEIISKNPDQKIDTIRYCIKALRDGGKIKNVGNIKVASWVLASYKTDEIAITKPRQIYAKPRVVTKKQVKAPENDNLAPGVLISKMDGVYVPTRAQPMRPGASDHEACPSLRADGRKPFTGQVLTLGVKAK